MKKITKLAVGTAAVIAVSAGVAGVTTYALMQPEQDKATSFYDEFQAASPARFAALDASSMQPVDLTKAAESSLNSVVHIMQFSAARCRRFRRSRIYLTFSSEMAVAADSRCRLLSREVSVRV